MKMYCPTCRVARGRRHGPRMEGWWGYRCTRPTGPPPVPSGRWCCGPRSAPPPRPASRAVVAAVEQRHPMPARERVSHLMGPGETGAAEDKDLERTRRAGRRLPGEHQARGESGNGRGALDKASASLGHERLLIPRVFNKTMRVVTSHRPEGCLRLCRPSLVRESSVGCDAQLHSWVTARPIPPFFDISARPRVRRCEPLGAPSRRH